MTQPRKYLSEYMVLVFAFFLPGPAPDEYLQDIVPGSRKTAQQGLGTKPGTTLQSKLQPGMRRGHRCPCWLFC